MKVRESGMPHEEMWNSFFDVEFILNKLEINNNVTDLAEFGSGYGTFTIPTSGKIKGTVFAFDITHEMIQFLRNKIEQKNISNIKVVNKDFLDGGTGLDNNSVDYVMLFNILHTEEPVELLKESRRILRNKGKVGVIHWVHSKDTPRGPSLEIRPTEQQCIGWIKTAGFYIHKGPLPLPPYHYGIMGIKL